MDKDQAYYDRLLADLDRRYAPAAVVRDKVAPAWRKKQAKQAATARWTTLRRRQERCPHQFVGVAFSNRGARRASYTRTQVCQLCGGQKSRILRRENDRKKDNVGLSAQPQSAKGRG